MLNKNLILRLGPGYSFAWFLQDKGSCASGCTF